MTTRDKASMGGRTARRAHEAELVALRKLAEELAHKRKERVTTGHLLAAIADHAGAASDLLKERLLDVDVLLKAARVVTDDVPDAIGRAVQRAREFASRSAWPEPSGIHLLYALCQDSTCAAHRAIAQCGSDVGKLRTSALQLATGIVMPRRAPRSASSLSGPIPVRPLFQAPSAQAAPSAPATAAKAAPVRGAPARSELPKPAPKTPPVAHPPRRRTRIAHPAHPHPHTNPNEGAAGFAVDPKALPLLTQIGVNLTPATTQGEL